MGVALAAIAAAAAITMTAPSAASAQGLPSICDEYPQLPVCNPEPEPPGPGPGPDQGEDQGPSADRGADAGELPFTGYPLTPLILLLLLLLLLGLAIRAYLAMRDRMRANAAGDSPTRLL